MNENENRYNNQEEPPKEEPRRDDLEPENPYAKFISREDPTDSQGRGIDENPYSKHFSGNSSADGDKKTSYHGDPSNPYSRYYQPKGDVGERASSGHVSDNPYSRYYGVTETERAATSQDHFPDSTRENDELQNDIESKQPVCEPVVPLIDENAVKHNFSKLGAGYLLFSLISTAVAYIITFAAAAVDKTLLDNILFRNLLTPVCLYLFALPILLIVLSRCEAKPPVKKKLGVGAFILFLITAFGFMYIGSIIGNTVMDFLSTLFKYDYSNGLESIIDEKNIWLTAIFTVIVAPIGEEFVFRKLIIDRTQKYGAWISIGLSGLMFGLMHGNFYQFFYAFALGLLLGYIYFHTGKLYLTVIIHAVVNFVGSVLTSFLSPLTEKMLEIDVNDAEAYLNFIRENLLGIIGILIFDIFVYGAMACAIIFPLVFRKKLKFPKGEIAIPKKRAFPIVILNVGIIAMLAAYLLEFASNIFLPLLV